MQRAIAIPFPRGRVARAVRWSAILPAVVPLFVTALLIQPPTQAVSGVPAKADPALYAMAASHPTSTFSVIVREATPSTSAAEDLVRGLGGHVTHELQIVGGFSATVAGTAVKALTDSPLVWRVWGDAHIQPQGSGTAQGQYASVAANTVWQKVIGLSNAWAVTKGAGVGIALLDTGVVPMPDLQNHISHVVDLTAEHDGLDRFGHGTHMAGILVGDGSSSNGTWTGVAPQANLISIKVAGVDGSTDVSMVMAGLQWAVTHRTDYNIRVLNLSFGTDSKQPYSMDPLDYAVEQAWNSGIFVAAAAGNQGPTAGTIAKPADDPFIVSVGAADLKNTTANNDDVVADFSARGPTQDGFNKPDLAAPGTTIVSVRDINSTIDRQYQSAVVSTNYFKGTGTSQATAVVSGVAALMFAANPSLTPNVAKAVLLQTTKGSLKGAGSGAGLVMADGAVKAAQTATTTSPVAPANQGLAPSTGLGSLEASRGSLHVYVMQCDQATNTCTPVLLTGEVDALGNAWSGNAWSGNAWSGNAWSGNAWSTYGFEGNAWSGNAWSGNAWSGNAWSGTSWSGNAWSGNAWSGNAWSGNAWSGNAWSAGAWSGNAWSGNAWSGNAWSGNAWSGNAWSGNAWSDSAWS
ncbi:MAG: S8 family peptidase [Actinomycetota bacterium]